MKLDTIKWNIQNNVLQLTLNRPEVLNAINLAMLKDFETVVAFARGNEEIGAITVTGAGPAFSAGADIRELKSQLLNPSLFKNWLAHFLQTFSRFADIGQVTIAGVNGLALAGGLEMLLTFDLVLISDRAEIGDQHINRNFVPGGGSTQRLSRCIGVRRAKEMILGGERISARQAVDWGLANAVVPHDQLVATLQEWGERYALKSARARASIKKLINQGMEMNLADGLALEIDEALQHFSSEDMKAGIEGFLETRKHHE